MVLKKLEKVFVHRVKRKKDGTVILEVFLDNATYDKWKTYLTKTGQDESSAMVNVLERGMDNFWIIQYKQLKEDYSIMEKVFKDYRKDNTILEKLEEENQELRKILEERDRKRLQEPRTTMG